MVKDVVEHKIRKRRARCGVQGIWVEDIEYGVLVPGGWSWSIGMATIESVGKRGRD